MTPNMADWMIDELQFKSIIYEHTGAVGLYNGDITKSDINVSEEMRLKLVEGIKRLQEAPPELRFFNPGTNYTQEDLIPIAFCCLVYGRTRVLKDKLIGVDEALSHAGQGDVIPVPEDTGITREDMAWRVAAQADVTSRPYSRQFQLLPCEMNMKDDGRWHITSYVNNLHPVKYHDIYGLIEDVFNMVIPQLNATLTPLKDMLHSRARITYKKAEYYPVPKEVEEQMPQPGEKEAQVEFEDRLHRWRMQNYKAIQPDCGKFIPWAVPRWMMANVPLDMATPIRLENEVDLNNEYTKRGLQVVVRIFNVELTPESPRFESGWHGAGQIVRLSAPPPFNTLNPVDMKHSSNNNQNDHICASAFYTVSLDNVNTPVMAFRHIAEIASLAEVEHEPNDTTWLKQVFGLDIGDPAVQESGKILCYEGRMVTFPSTIQHRYEAIELADKTKPGSAKALSFFLVDPNIRVTSTANVPPQRLDWAFEGADAAELEGLNESLDKLSMGFQDRRENLPFSMNEAKRLHAQVFKELIEFTKYTSVAFDSNRVSI